MSKRAAVHHDGWALIRTGRFRARSLCGRQSFPDYPVPANVTQTDGDVTCARCLALLDEALELGVVRVSESSGRFYVPAMGPFRELLHRRGVLS